MPGGASAQIKIYGTLTCAETTEQRREPIAAKPGHTLWSMKQNCSWPEPLSIGNSQTGNSQNTFQSDIQGAHGDDSMTYVVHMSNGDQVNMKFSGTSVFDASGGIRSLTGTWVFSEGPGILKGVTGTGTYAGLPRAAGGLTYDIEGMYVLPSDVQQPAPLQPARQQQTGTDTKS